MFLNQRPAEFSFSTPSAPSLTYSFKQIGNYLTTEQVLPVEGIQFQSEPLRKPSHLVELPNASSCCGEDDPMTG